MRVEVGRVLGHLMLLVGSVLVMACSAAPLPDGRPPAIAPASDLPVAVGFDLDDTLLFSSPAFDHATASGVERRSIAFWEMVNAADAEHSTFKSTTLRILREHQQRGDTVYVVTARHPHNIEPLLDFIEASFDIPRSRVFFETEGKADRIRKLGIATFYGDADSDITAAQEAGARAVRILRSTESTYRRSYNPGAFGEEIVEGSEN